MNGAGAAILAATLAALAAPAAAEPCARASRVHPDSRGDRLRVFREGGACVVQVRHRRGIGAARLAVTVPADALLLRFSGFAELEGLTLTSPAGTLLCEIHRPEGAAPLRHCRLDGAAVPGLQRTGEGFELPVPPALVPLAGQPIEVRWADFWR